jgi:uncharacterized membrane protein
LSVTLLLDRTAKTKTLAELFGAWLFLPLVSPLLLLALPSLAERFWASNPSFWSSSYQYSLPIAPILAYAAIDGTCRLRRYLDHGRRRKLDTAIAPITVAVGLILVVWIVQPLADLSSYMSASRAAAIDTCLDRIPATASVAASDNLIPHLTHRQHVYEFPHSNTEYRAVADPQPEGNHSPTLHATGKTVQARYSLLCQRGGVSVLKLNRA